MNGIVISMLSTLQLAAAADNYNYFSTVPTSKSSRFRYGNEKVTQLITSQKTDGSGIGWNVYTSVNLNEDTGDQTLRIVH